MGSRLPEGSIVSLPKSLLDASLDLFSDFGMIRFGYDLIKERYGAEWTVLDGKHDVGTVRVRLRATAPMGLMPHWIMLTFQHDDGRRMVAHASYGETVLLRLPDGHYGILAFFMGVKRNRAHRPPLLAIADAYRGLFIGRQRVVHLYGRHPGVDDMTRLLSSGSENTLPFVLPQHPSTSAAKTPPAPSPTPVLTSGLRAGLRAGVQPPAKQETIPTPAAKTSRAAKKASPSTPAAKTPPALAPTPVLTSGLRLAGLRAGVQPPAKQETIPPPAAKTSRTAKKKP
jgi:hypothetical protein